MLQREAGYIDARPSPTRSTKNLLQRTAGPYIGSNPVTRTASIFGPVYLRNRTLGQKSRMFVKCLFPSHRWAPGSALRRPNHARCKAGPPSPNTPPIVKLARHLLLWWGLHTQAWVTRNGAYTLRMGHGRRRDSPCACSRARDRGRSELFDRRRRRCVERCNRLPVRVL
jgi:hypothetical protein